MSSQDRKKFAAALVLSIFLHAAILLMFKYDFLFSSPSPESAAPDEQPLTLVFQKPVEESKPTPPPADKFYELMENPNANKAEPQVSNILSTESSLAASPEVVTPSQTPVPKSELKKNPARQQEEPTAPVEEHQGTQPILAYKPGKQFSRDLLAPPSARQGNEHDSEENQGQSEVVQKDWEAELVGDFALSTYAWNWAPYWLAFKRKLMRNWFAPPAYYRLGLIYGYTIVRFRVMRDGQMVDFRVLQHVGHHSLEESSVSAIKSSFPFKPLPEDFPDPYLEVTIKMMYPNLREYRNQ